MNWMNSINCVIIWLVIEIVYIIYTIMNCVITWIIIGIVVIIVNIVNNGKINTIIYHVTIYHILIYHVTIYLAIQDSVQLDLKKGCQKRPKGKYLK